MDILSEINGDPDWNMLFTDHGKELVAMAKQLLSDPQQRARGILIVRESLFEEEIENPDGKTWLAESDLDVAPLVSPLVTVLAEDSSAVHALFALARHGVDVTAATDVVVPLLDKGQPKDVRAHAFAVRIHALCRAGRAGDVIAHLKGNAAFKTILFDEIIVWAARSYDISPFLAVAAKELQAKGESTVRGAVDLLCNLAAAGVDIGETAAFLDDNIVRLSGFTEASRALATYLVKKKDGAALATWLASPDRKKQLCAYRGIRLAAKSGLDATFVLDDRELRAQLDALVADPANRLPGLNE